VLGLDQPTPFADELERLGWLARIRSDTRGDLGVDTVELGPHVPNELGSVQVQSDA
jgi:hypothetical protein